MGLPRRPSRAAPHRAHPVQLKSSSCSCGGGCPSCKATAAYASAEREADAVAAQVMSMTSPSAAAGPDINIGRDALMRQPEEEMEETVQRQAMDEEEEELVQTKAMGEEEEELVQTKADGTGAPSAASNPMAGMGAGRPLSPGLRSFFEPRFGRSFADVRIHDSGAAHARAQDLNAQAFTYGKDIVFGGGRYDPESAVGRFLLAHELTHVVQQSKTQMPLVQRRCLTGDVCDEPIHGAPGQFVTDALEEEAEARSERREQETPEERDMSGQGRRAVNLERLAEENGLGILTSVSGGIFVDLDMASSVGGWTRSCESFFGMIGQSWGGSSRELCIFLPEARELQAAQYLSDPEADTIGGVDRSVWLAQTLTVLGHEVGHVLFDRGRPEISAGSACDHTTVIYSDGQHNYDVRFYMSELAAILSEFPPLMRTYADNRGHQPLMDYMRDWFTYKTETAEESILGVLTALRCKCECDDVGRFVRSAWLWTTEAWPREYRVTLNRALADRASLNWPLGGWEPHCVNDCIRAFERSSADGPQRLADLNSCYEGCD